MQVLMQSSLQNHEETVNNLLQKNNKERQLQLDLAIAEQVPFNTTSPIVKDLLSTLLF